MILSKQKMCSFRKKGSILVFALIILSLILISALSMASTTLTQLRATNVTGRSTAAIQNADKGVEQFLQQIYHERSLIETLSDVVASGALNDLRCVEGRIIAEAGLTSPFEIVTYRKRTPSSPPLDLVEITGSDGCDTFLGDVARFKVIGEDDKAARALGVDITDSTERGLVGYWGFEDNARAQSDLGQIVGGSPLVADGSRFRHELTLCPVDDAPHGTTIPFDRCPQILRDSSGVPNIIPAQAASDPIDNIYMDHDGTHLDPSDPPGAFVEGIVDEQLRYAAADIAAPTYHTQAIYFNGTSTYLAINDTEHTTPDTAYYRNQDPDASNKPAANYVDPADNRLSPTDALAISLFFKKESPGNQSGVLINNGTIVDQNYGYVLYFDNSGNLRFKAQGDGQDATTSVPATYVNNGDWHHVAVIWDRDSLPSGLGLRVPKIYIDGVLRSVGGTQRTQALVYDSSIPFTVGGIYDGSNINIFDRDAFRSSPLERGFHGAIDELRIYDRALTVNEIKGLCSKAKGSVPSDCNITP